MDHGQDVDFVVGAGGDDGFEDLPGEEPRQVPTWVWKAGAAAAVVGVVVVIAQRDPPRQASSAPASTAAVSSAAVAQPAAPVLPARGPTSFTPASAVVIMPDGCFARGYLCRAELGVPAAAQHAVHAVLPGARWDALTSVVAHRPKFPTTLFFRQINARAGRVQIIVRIQLARSSDGNRMSKIDEAGLMNLYLEQRLGRYLVQIQANGPSGAVPVLNVLKTLAADRRLVQLY